MDHVTTSGVGQQAVLTKPASNANQPPTSADLARIKYGASLIGAAFVLLGIVFGVAVSQFTSASDVVAVVGSMATVVGTIVAAFFGIQAASSGKAAAEAGRADAERAARMALGKLDPPSADELLKIL
jgi:hypothetical protein